MNARTLWCEAVGRGVLRGSSLPDPGLGEVRVRAVLSGVSKGTERLIWAGRVPVDQHDAMRGPHQKGEFPFPVAYGYGSVGVVEAGSLAVGTRVFCLHPHADRYVVPAEDVHAIPESVPDERAVLTANIETAINAVWDADVRPGERVSVVGAGVVGCAIAWLIGQIDGIEVTLIDILPERESVAEALGVSFRSPEAAVDGQHRVIHASGTADGLSLALEIAAFEATITEVSWYGDQPVAVPLGSHFHSRRLTLRSSQVGCVAPSHRASWSCRRRLGLALEKLADPALDALLDRTLRFEDAPDRLPGLLGQPGLCHALRY